MKKKSFPAIIGFALLMSLNPFPVLATTLTVLPGTDGSIIMTGDSDISGVEWIELALSYSPAFSEPRVTVQGGEYTNENMARDSKPGLLKIAISRDVEEMREAPFSLTVEFGKKPANQPCPVKSVVAKYFYASGETVLPDIDMNDMKKMEPLQNAAKPATPAEGRSSKTIAPGSGAAAGARQ